MLQSSSTEEPTTIQRHSKLLPRHNAPGECWALIKRQSQGSSQVSLQCLPAAPPDLYRQLSLLITCVRPVAPLKPCFLLGVGHAISYSPSRRSFAFMCRGMVSRWQSQKVRMTLRVFQNVQQQRFVEQNPKTVAALSTAVSYSPKLFLLQIVAVLLFIIIRDLCQFHVGCRLYFVLSKCLFYGGVF